MPGRSWHKVAHHQVNANEVINVNVSGGGMEWRQFLRFRQADSADEKRLKAASFCRNMVFAGVSNLSAAPAKVSCQSPGMRRNL